MKMLECAHCKKEVGYDDAKICRACEGPLCVVDCANAVACDVYLKESMEMHDDD